MLLSLTCIIALWANLAVSGCVRSNWHGLILTSFASIVLYVSDTAVSLIAGWAGMGTFSAGLTMKKDSNSRPGQTMILWSTISTLLVTTGFSILGCWKLPDLSDENERLIGEIILLAGISIKTLLWPQSYWLFSAMKGIAPMSALVHSLTVVIGGTYLILELLEEGWMENSVLFVYSMCFVISTIVHSYQLILEYYPKRIIGCSTNISINAINSFVAFDSQISFGYALLHGLSKAYLFISYGSYSINQLLALLLLGGSPMSLTNYTKHGLSELTATNYLIWMSAIYTIIIFRFYELNTNLNIVRDNNHLSLVTLPWIGVGSLTGSICPVNIGDPIIVFASIILYRFVA